MSPIKISVKTVPSKSDSPPIQISTTRTTSEPSQTSPQTLSEPNQASSQTLSEPNQIPSQTLSSTVTQTPSPAVNPTTSSSIQEPPQTPRPASINASIRILTEDIINKIAAGEVIERPASVVKELIENSIDAKATQINIFIEDSGKGLIKVVDNGEGMNPEDAQVSVLRHTTSKLKEEKDLFKINTLGFRGEALASIAAVSQLSIITKQKVDEGPTDEPAEQPLEGFNLVVEGGVTVSSGIIGAEPGTIMEIRNLFYNTPARKKFLKSDQVELRHIIDIVTRYALINHDISFNLFHEGHTLLNSPATAKLRNNIASIYGTKVAKELLEVDFMKEGVKVSGFIAPPSHARNDKNQQFLYINGRWVKNNLIINAVYNAFHSLLFVNKHPILLLNLELDPQRVDVNVHPAKTEVKIEQWEIVSDVVFTAVKNALQENNLIPTLDVELEKQLTFGLPAVKEEEKREEKTAAKYAFEPSRQSIFPPETASQPPTSGLSISPPTLSLGHPPLAEVPELKEQVQRGADSIFIENDKKSFMVEEGKVILTSENAKIPSMKLMGQVHNTFFVAETEGGLFLLDQHAVHERVLYEKFMDQYLNKDIAVQKLLQGDILEFSPVEKAAVVEHLEKLKEFGFRLEEFGGGSFVIKTIPSLLGRTQTKELIFEILAKLQEGKSHPEQVQEEIITRMACRSAVMAGDELTVSQMELYLKELNETELPWTCPHGRPTMFKISVDELEKKFKRKG